jgi:D-alanine--poly(phosphoribitol) ligase subunit 1
MASLFCGRLFCPLETNHPIDRIVHCLEDFNPKLILTDSAGEDTLGGLRVPTVNVEDLEGAQIMTHEYGESAYVIYTSGSTGLPKGVKVSRRSMDKFLDWSIPFYQVRPSERWAQFSSLGFDLSLVDLLTCLLSGGTLVPVVATVDRLMPARFVSEFSISIWHSVPSVIPMLVRETVKAPEQLQSLRLASFCGEPLFPQSVMSLLTPAPQVQVVNTYGPTEGTFFCTSQPVDVALCAEIINSSLPIGDPIPGWAFDFAVGPDGDDLPELILSSEYLSDGYISATPDQAKFGMDTNTGLPFYRTGDLVRRVGDRVFFAQRADNQVKISGNRLDLTEVEYHALQFGATEAKAFTLSNSVFVAVAIPAGKTEEAMSQYFRAKLPVFAVPKDILVRESLPRNANAKIDTQALKEEVATKWKLHDPRP